MLLNNCKALIRTHQSTGIKVAHIELYNELSNKIKVYPASVDRIAQLELPENKSQYLKLLGLRNKLSTHAQILINTNDKDHIFTSNIYALAEEEDLVIDTPKAKDDLKPVFDLLQELDKLNGLQKNQQSNSV